MYEKRIDALVTYMEKYFTPNGSQTVRVLIISEDRQFLEKLNNAQIPHKVTLLKDNTKPTDWYIKTHISKMSPEVLVFDRHLGVPEDLKDSVRNLGIEVFVV